MLGKEIPCLGTNIKPELEIAKCFLAPKIYDVLIFHLSKSTFKAVPNGKWLEMYPQQPGKDLYREMRKQRKEIICLAIV